MKRPRRLLRLVIEWVVLAALWLLFTGKTTAPEVAMGLVAAALATLAMVVAQFRRLANVAVLPRAFAQAWRLPLEVLRGTWQLLVVLVRQVFGREAAASLLVASPYDAVGDGARDATKRALAEGYTSITPSDVVVDVDRERRLLLIHRVAEAPTSKITLDLGAEA